jgi:hypothetical protein
MIIIVDLKNVVSLHHLIDHVLKGRYGAALAALAFYTNPNSFKYTSISLSNPDRLASNVLISLITA